MEDVFSELYKAPRELSIPLPNATITVAEPLDNSVPSLLQQADELETSANVFGAWALLNRAFDNGCVDDALLSKAIRLGNKIHKYRAVTAYAGKLFLGHRIHNADLIEASRAYAMIGDFVQSDRLLQQAFDKADNAEWHIGYAFHHEKRGALNWALMAYRLALRHSPESLSAKIGLMKIALEMKDVSLANDTWNTLSHLITDSSLSAYLKGRLVFLKDNDTRKADALLMESVKLQPWNLDAWLWLGHIRASAQLPIVAEYAYRHAWFLAFDCADTHFYLGWIYRILENNTNAIALLESAIKISPGSSAIANSLIEVYSAVGRNADAEALKANFDVQATVVKKMPSVMDSITKAVPAQSAKPLPLPETPIVLTTPTMVVNEFQNIETCLAENSQEVFAQHLDLAERLMPGPVYLQYLQTVHQWLHPKNYLEIGVETGSSLAYAKPGTKCIGIDPEPKISVEFTADTHIYPLPSDDFFKQHNLQEILGEPLEFVFIDGLHVFDQVLRDFINVERNSTKRTLVFFHDTYPICELTQRPNRNSIYWSGDPWKIVPCLKECRPDLEVITIKTHPSGLSLVLGCDPKNTVLSDNYTTIERKFSQMRYEDIEADKDKILNAIPNDWAYVRKRILANRS